MKKIILFLLVAVSVCKTTGSLGQVLASDSLALVDLYNSTNGAHWVTPWNLAMPVTDWAGVGISDGRVTGFTLSYDSLNGSIPSSFGNLNALYHIEMNNNLLSGNLPSSIGNLTGLDYSLDLSGNQLSGNIPTELGNLTYIESIFLYYNEFTGNVPASLAYLPNIGQCYLDDNQLSGIIPSDFDSMPWRINNTQDGIGFSVTNNHYTYAGMEELHLLWDGWNITHQAYPVGFGILPQDPIPLYYNGGIFSVSAGGTPSNNTYYLFNGDTAQIAKQVGDSTFTITGPGSYQIRVYNADFIDYGLGSTIISIPGDSLIVPAHPRIQYANREYKGPDGWINYYWDNNTPDNYTDDTLLLSLDLNGQDIGTIGDGTFSVKVVATPGAGSNKGVTLTNPLLANLSDFWAMNRYWEVTPTHEPTADVGVRFYYNNQDLTDVNGSYPSHNATNQQFVFYKQAGGNPDPTTNLAGAMGIINLQNSSYASDSTWTYNQYTASEQYAEFSVSNFSGGGSGGISYTLNNTTIDTTIMPDQPRIEYANGEYTGADGWTNYYWDNNTPYDYTDDTLLLSLNKNGQNIGTIGDGTFSVKLAATVGAGSNTAIFLTNPLITNPSGYWVMNRYWLVTPTTEPTSNVGVRFYYNNQDLADVNGSYPTHNLLDQQLIFYKEIGGNPDPTTNLAGATKIISILPNRYASDTTWTYTPISDLAQYAQFSVASFSGGGGGGTGNDEALPIKLLSFTATKEGSKNLLQWTTTQEINSSYFAMERSGDGVNFTCIGQVGAAGNSSVSKSYSLVDAEPVNGMNYYRLKMMDKDGQFSYSEIRSINEVVSFAVSIYPNPVQNSLNLNFNSDKEMTVEVEVFDNGGKVVATQLVQVAAGVSTASINVEGLSGGEYYVRVVGSEGMTEERFVKE